MSLKSKNMPVQTIKQSPGQYSISISTSLPWKRNTVAAAPEIIKRRKKTLKPIINPIFEKCAQLTEDNFWNATFMDCARGKFPRNFLFKNNLLVHKKGSKVTTLDISKSATDVFISTMKFFQVTAGIMSAEDRKRMQRLEEEKISETLAYDYTWKEIRAEKYKEILLCEFINDLTEEFGLNNNEKRELTTTIKKGLMLKYFSGDNIVMEEGKITEIQGLSYNDEMRCHEIEKAYIKYSEKQSKILGIESEDEEVTLIKFIEIWKKFLETLDSKRAKKLNNFSSSLLAESVLESTQDYTGE